jgi:glycosyltransferase involved in cell wall biosynthesis
MHVVQITPMVVSGDGVGRAARARLDGLARAGHRVELIASTLEMELPAGVTAHVIPVDRCYRSHAWPAETIRSLDAADVVLLDFAAGHSLGRILSACRPRRLALNYYGLTPPEFLGDRGATQEYLVSVRRLRKVAGCDLLIAHSDFSRREFTDLTGYTPARSVVVPLFGDAGGAPTAAAAWAPGRAIRLVCVGRMYPNKNYEVAIQAVARLRSRGVAAELRHVGGGGDAISAAYRRRLGVLIDALGAGGYITLAGRVSEAELIRTYADCHAVVVPSLHEGFALPVVEGMAQRRPVFAARAGALPETVGDAGILFDPFDSDDLADRIADLFGSDETGRTELSRRAADRAADLSAEAFQERTNRALLELWAVATPAAVAGKDPLPPLGLFAVSWDARGPRLPDARGTVRLADPDGALASGTRLTASVFDPAGAVGAFHHPLDQTWRRDGTDWVVAFSLAALPDASHGRLLLAVRRQVGAEWFSIGRPHAVEIDEIRTARAGPAAGRFAAARLVRLAAGSAPDTRYPETRHLSRLQRLLAPVAVRILDLMYTYFIPRAEVQELFNQSLLDAAAEPPDRASGAPTPPGPR